MSELLPGIFDGVDARINSYLFSDARYSFRHKRSCIALSKAQPDSFDGSALISAIYRRIEENLSGCPNRPASSKNWTLRATDTENAIKPNSKNTSDEVCLERAIIQRWPGKWMYQMPVASGLFGNSVDKRSAVDLVFRRGDGLFDFVELKFGSNTPLHAAMEILCYGLVYLASRKDSAGRLAYGKANPLPVMNASAISLIVLAPSKYYKSDYKLEWLERSINIGLATLVEATGLANLKIDFRFEKFQDGFVWKHDMTPDALPEPLPRHRVY